MKKIMIMGSSGSGKSTLARQLSEHLDIEAIHLDACFHKPNWIALKKEEQISVHDEIMKKELWIIDGNWSASLETRLSEADLVIYLNFGMLKCLYRVISRYLKNRGKVRIDSAEGCEDKLDADFIFYIMNYHLTKKKNIIEKLKKQIVNKPLVIINSKTEKKKFLDWMFDEMINVNYNSEEELK